MTAVEWLISKLKNYDRAGLKYQSNYVIEMPTHILTELEEHAKEMEKQQIIDARVNGVAEGIDVGASVIKEDISKSHEIYYNETFNNQDPDCKDKC